MPISHKRIFRILPIFRTHFSHVISQITSRTFAFRISQITHSLRPVRGLYGPAQRAHHSNGSCCYVLCILFNERINEYAPRFCHDTKITEANVLCIFVPWNEVPGSRERMFALPCEVVLCNCNFSHICHEIHFATIN